MTLLRTALALDPKQEVLVVTDEQHGPELECIFKAGDIVGVSAVAFIAPLEAQRRFGQNDVLCHVGREALTKCDGLVVLTEFSKATTPFRMKCLQAVDVNRQCRAASMPGVRLVHFPFIDADYDRIKRDSDDLAGVLLRTDVVTIRTMERSGASHQLEISVEGQTPQTSVGLPDKGSWGNVPSGETFILPRLGCATGSIVVNGSVPGMVLRRDSVVLEIKEGSLTSICSADHAVQDYVRGQFFANYARRKPLTTNSSVLSEVGFGTNRSIRKFTGIPILDEKIYGTIHVAFGRNDALGGSIKGASHLDLVVRGAQVHLDCLDHPVLAKGRYSVGHEDSEPSWRASYPAHHRPETVRFTGADCFCNARHQLMVRWYPPRGKPRETRVGDTETSVIAGKLLSIIQGSQQAPLGRVAIRAAGARRHISAAQVDGTLRVLLSYGIVKVGR